jgi:hypothetical protein
MRGLIVVQYPPRRKEEVEVEVEGRKEGRQWRPRNGDQGREREREAV